MFLLRDLLIDDGIYTVDVFVHLTSWLASIGLVVVIDDDTFSDTYFEIILFFTLLLFFLVIRVNIFFPLLKLARLISWSV